MRTVWTKDQQSAINERGTNLLVSAGAGAGKTAVLVERIIARLLDPADPIDLDEFLVVTFTNAAASEMRARLGEALAKLAAKDPTQVDLRRQQLLLNKSSISTLHSFCLEILRQHYYRLDLDPAFKVADDIEAEIIKADAVDKVLEGCYEQLSPSFVLLAEGFGGKHDDVELSRLILRLAEYSRSQPDPQSWLQGLAGHYAPCPSTGWFAHHKWYQEFSSTIAESLNEARDKLVEACELAGRQKGPASYLPLLEVECRQLKDLVDAAPLLEWDELRGRLAAVKFDRLPTIKKDVDEALRSMAKVARDNCKKILREELLESSLAQTAAEVRHGLLVAQGMVETLAQLVITVQEEFQRAKRARNLVDFNDLEHLVLSLLTPEDSPVASELKQQFKEILVDEYQDINAVQEKILSLISRGTNLVTVGDVKQSIYRFRLADPSLFMAKYHSYRAKSSPGTVVHLAHNFRSRPHVIAGVNHIFRQLMSQRVGEVDYDAEAALVSAAEYPATEDEPTIELLFLDSNALPGDKDSGSDGAGAGAGVEHEADAAEGGDAVLNSIDLDLDTPTKEARAIAERIAELVHSGKNLVWDREQGASRPLCYRDIVILLRAAKSWGGVFSEVFSQMSIPSHVDVGTGYFAATEVSVMLSLLKVVDNPEQDIALAAVLRAPWVGLTGAELETVRSSQREGSFLAAVRAAAETPDLVPRALFETLENFLAVLHTWREVAVREPLPDLIWRLYRDTGYYNYVGALPNGVQRQANLRALYDRACQFEGTSFKGLFKFLRFINRLQEDEQDLGQAPALAENEDVVRVMSIHKSKGLEFPVVVVAGLGREFNRQDFNSPLLIHREMGVGLSTVDLEWRCKYPTLAFYGLKHRLMQELLSEEMRILYVALTRAKERLILAGSRKNLETKVQRWQALGSSNRATPQLTIVKGRCPLDWLGPAVYQHSSLQSEDGRAEDGLRFRRIFPHITGAEVAAQPDHADELQNIRAGLPLADHGFGAAVKHLFEWRYPHLPATTARIKSSVSELKARVSREEMEEPEEPVINRPRPSVPKTKKSALTGAELGTALHMVMLHIDLSKDVTGESVALLLENLLERQLLTKAETHSVDIALILGFFASPLGRRLLAADEVWRELPFALAVDAKAIHPDVEGEQSYIQGVIDCLFREGERLIIVDFKSDQVTRETRDNLVKKYEVQLSYYAQAVSTIARQAVAEKYLYLFRLGEAVSLD